MSTADLRSALVELHVTLIGESATAKKQSTDAGEHPLSHYFGGGDVAYRDAAKRVADVCALHGIDLTSTGQGGAP